MPYDDVYAMATPGRVFDMFTNQAHALRAPPSRRPGGSLMLFAGADNAAALMRESDEVIVERFLADLHALYPADARRRRRRRRAPLAAGQRVRQARPHALQAALEGAPGAHRNLHLAGDYFAELGSMEAAARTGVAAAERVEARLGERSRRGRLH